MLGRPLQRPSTARNPRMRIAARQQAAESGLTQRRALAFAARLMLPLMRKRHAWRVIDGVIAGIMFVLAAGMLFAGGWL